MGGGSGIVSALGFQEKNRVGVSLFSQRMAAGIVLTAGFWLRR